MRVAIRLYRYFKKAVSFTTTKKKRVRASLGYDAIGTG